MFGKRLIKIMNDLGVTQAELSKRTGIGQSSLSAYMMGKYEPKQDNIGKIARALGVAPSYLLGWDDEQPMVSEPQTIYGGNIFEFPESVMVPVYGKISAGTPIEAIEDIEEYIDVPKKWIDAGKKIIGLVVDGDSMYPRYMDGDVVVIECGADFHSGDDCAVYVNGYEATIKQVKRTTDGVELIPVNTAYAPKRYKNGEYSVLGVILEMRRKVLNK